MSDIVELNRDVEDYVLQAGHPRSRHSFKQEDARPLTLLHLSDIHANRTAWERMVAYANHYQEYIDLVLHTGDYCGGSQKQYVDMYTVADCALPLYNCVGNHDCTTGDWSLADKALAHRLLFNHTEGWDVTFMDVPHAMSYYKDFPDSRIRLIVLDDYYHVFETRQWLRALLAEAREQGLHVITAQHEPTGPIEDTYGALFQTRDDYRAVFEANELRRKTYAYDHRNRVLYEDILAEHSRLGGILVCNLAGHDHVDQFGCSPRGVLNVAVQNATCCHMLGDMRRVPGTRSEDCFNVVSVDTTLGLLKVVRIGAHVDHYLRSHRAMCFDYRNGCMVTEIG